MLESIKKQDTHIAIVDLRVSLVHIDYTHNRLATRRLHDIGRLWSERFDGRQYISLQTNILTGFLPFTAKPAELQNMPVELNRSRQSAK